MSRWRSRLLRSSPAVRMMKPMSSGGLRSLRIARAFERMVDDSGYEVQLNGGYTAMRSFEFQCDEIFRVYSPQRAAMPGHSEHELGLAVDVSGYAWLSSHAHEYGFVQSYPAGSEWCTGYQAESWHWRYVGTSAARTIHRHGLVPQEYLSGVRCDGTPITDIHVYVEVSGYGHDWVEMTLYEAQQRANRSLRGRDAEALCGAQNPAYRDVNTCSGQYPGWLRICNSDYGDDLQYSWQLCGTSCQGAAMGEDDTCGGGFYDF